MSWYYVVGSEQKGPVTEEDLDTLHRKGEITGETLIWSQGMDNWKTYASSRGGSIPGQALSSPTDLVTCAISGKMVPASSAIQVENVWVSAECKEQALQRIREGLPLGSTVRYGGFWIRFVAVFVDSIIINICVFPIMILFGFILGLAGIKSESLQIVIMIVNILVSLVIAASYEIILIGKKGATVGKMACGLKVTDPDGKPIGYGKSTGRYFAKILSALTLYIGFIMAGFDDEKRALHDRLCETRVVHK